MATRNKTTESRRRAETLGRRAEFWAKQLLRMKGYRIDADRYKTNAGEIDIVAIKPGVVVFVEVKARKTIAGGLESISKHQQQRIIAAADIWLASNSSEKFKPSQDFAVRFDVIIVAPGHLPHHIMDAFRPGW